MAAAQGVHRLSPLIPTAIAIAWAIAVVAQMTGTAHLLHHDALIEGGVPLWAAVFAFVAAWQAMIVAMMLPSSLPLVRLFAVASANQSGGGAAMRAFLAGYAVVWTGFGIVAFFGDVALHHIVDATPWLEARPWLIGGSVLVLAGAFQFSPLKERCLQKCRLPANFLMTRYRRGAKAAFAIGRDHGVFCVGCCWALMLVTFAAGFANLWWMAALTALMTYEKTGRYARCVVPLAGALLLVAGILLIVRPAWIPGAAF